MPRKMYSRFLIGLYQKINKVGDIVEFILGIR